MYLYLFLPAYGEEFVEELVSLASPTLEAAGSVPDKVMAEWIRLKNKLYNR
ncbi:hypothetical protein DPMN_119023 [Dreissena polymorpha]|uniref:Uncharacterized protein n=1 Tax=Dreissena polymorpha TaxID=45954 RepID=A0A9D4GHJ2_DREPO|nr:hypothetical protein DPMN_119023 [Dreissena polymorpha]